MPPTLESQDGVLMPDTRLVSAGSLRNSAILDQDQSMNHFSDHDLERYHLGMVVDEAELSTIEEHLLHCSECIDRAESSARYVDAIRAASIAGNFDLEISGR